MFALRRNRFDVASGRIHVRRLACAVIAGSAVLALSFPARAEDVQIAVSQKGGTYDVRAAFTVGRGPSVVRTVLTDYVSIPAYMPQVQTSRLLHRTDDRAIVEQEAVSRFLTFSRRIHLVLEVTEAPLTIEFKDVCGQSFEHYQGAWSMMNQAGDTRVAYRLTAKPSFDVPGWLLSRLLKRDAAQMIQKLQAEIATR